MISNEATLNVIRQTRHDWLNKVQLIKGHLTLGNVDRIQQILEEIVQDCHGEAMLSSLGVPSFATMLITYHWNSPKLIVKYKVLGEPRMLSNDETLTEQTLELFKILEEFINPYYENVMMVTIDVREENLRIFYDVQGRFDSEHDMEKALQQLPTNEMYEWDITYCDEDMLTLEWNWKC